jgi:hypothetical protein
MEMMESKLVVERGFIILYYIILYYIILYYIILYYIILYYITDASPMEADGIMNHPSKTKDDRDLWGGWSKWEVESVRVLPSFPGTCSYL